jgi:hypothetical protein
MDLIEKDGMFLLQEIEATEPYLDQMRTLELYM